LQSRGADETPAANAGLSIILKLVDKDNNGRAFERIVTDALIIGRKRELSDIVIDYDKTVSSRQCKVYVKCDELYVADLKGTNCTYLNGKPVKEDMPLSSGDVLGLGRVNLRVTITHNT
jgi:pSer/pThr/pTyr-binding forkhead associated (FHA) protein